MAFFNPEASLVIHRGKLPHWRQEGAIYFVTFHLADSLPQTKLEWLRREKELWLRLNPEPHTEVQRRQYHERFTQTVDRWLDAGHGRCILAKPECKATMESSLIHFDGVRYELGEFVVMPNHVHAIVAPIGEHPLTRILHNWKSFTAHRFKRVLNSYGCIWHRESFDHIIRSAQHLAKFEAYIVTIRNRGSKCSVPLYPSKGQTGTVRLLRGKASRFAFFGALGRSVSADRRVRSRGPESP